LAQCDYPLAKAGLAPPGRLERDLHQRRAATLQRRQSSTFRRIVDAKREIFHIAVQQ
jgi:hypothetical protein